LDIGITEEEFWNMTFTEVRNRVDCYTRRKKVLDQERATYDYILADLIGRSVSRLYSSTNNLPEIEKVYPGIFNEDKLQEQRDQKKAELSAMRFRMFAISHNKRIKEADG